MKIEIQIWKRHKATRPTFSNFKKGNNRRHIRTDNLAEKSGFENAINLSPTEKSGFEIQ